MKTPKQNQHDPRHDGGEGESAVAELGHDGEKHGHKRAGGAGNLKTRSAEQRNDKAGDNAGPKTLLRSYAGGDSEADGKRQSDNADGDAGSEVGEKISSAVTSESRQNGRLKFAHEAAV